MSVVIVTIFVPDDHPSVADIVRGSGVVGKPLGESPEPQVEIYYEGNLHSAVGLDDWESRLVIAAGRLAARYPTIARSVVPERALRVVGTFDTEFWSIQAITDPAAVQQWTGEKW